MMFAGAKQSWIHFCVSLSLALSFLCICLLSILQSQQNWTHLYTICNGIRDINPIFRCGICIVYMRMRICVCIIALIQCTRYAFSCMFIFILRVCVFFVGFTYLLTYLFIFLLKSFSSRFTQNLTYIFIYVHCTEWEWERERGSEWKIFQRTISAYASPVRIEGE